MLRFIIVLRCQDWFLIWFGLELNIIRFIILIYKRYSIISVESCLKYFFVQSLGSAIFISLFYFRGEVINVLGSIILTYKLGGGPFFFLISFSLWRGRLNGMFYANEFSKNYSFSNYSYGSE